MSNFSGGRKQQFQFPRWLDLMCVTPNDYILYERFNDMCALCVFFSLFRTAEKEKENLSVEVKRQYVIITQVVAPFFFGRIINTVRFYIIRSLLPDDVSP